jgi:hypothetical protein
MPQARQKGFFVQRAKRRAKHKPQYPAYEE